MRLFFERLLYSFKKQITNWSVALLAGILFVLIMSVVGYIAIILPIQILYIFIGDYAILWIVFEFIVVVILNNWKTLKGWFIWQFIEPFKKESK